MKAIIFSYAVGMLSFESLVVTILYLCNISPFSSSQIMLFLKIFIPLVMVGNYIILRTISYNTKSKKDDVSEVLLIVFSVAAFLCGAIFYQLISILLGAALIETVEETFAFSCLCSALTVFPLFVVHEGKWDEFVNYLPESMEVDRSLNDCIKMISMLTVIGAWLGAFPIPLDWDRDWQNGCATFYVVDFGLLNLANSFSVWPITCCVGAIAGKLIGECYVILSCFGVIATRNDDWKNKIT